MCLVESQDICLVETQDKCVESSGMCFVESQYEGGGLRPPPQRWGRIRPPPSVVSFVLALNKAHVLALNTAHSLRLDKAGALALNRARVLPLHTKIRPVFTANTEEAAFGLLHKGVSKSSLGLQV